MDSAAQALVIKNEKGTVKPNDPLNPRPGYETTVQKNKSRQTGNEVKTANTQIIHALL